MVTLQAVATPTQSRVLWARQRTHPVPGIDGSWHLPDSILFGKDNARAIYT